MPELNVLIVGAGIAGLTTSIALARYKSVRVTVLERFPSNGPVGNGIQVPPNAAHVMKVLGLLEKHIQRAVGPATSAISMHYSTGAVLVKRDFTRCGELYAAPWLLMQRADYLTVLLDEARRLGVQVRFGCDVGAVNFDTPSLRLTTGVKSTVRSLMHPSIRQQRANAFAYRALYTKPQLSSPTLRSILHSSSCLFWLGPEMQVIWYPLRGGELFNLVVCVVDADFNARCERGDARELLRERMADWQPQLRELMDLADEVVCFPLLTLQDLPFWSKGCVTVIGDAAHPTLPYLGQGGAMCVEDGLILGDLLGRMTEHVDATGSGTFKQRIPTILESFRSIRHPRTMRIRSKSRLSGKYNQLAAGPLRQARDDDAASYGDEDTCISDWPWIDSRWNRELLSYKADEVAGREFDRLVDSGALDTNASGTEMDKEEKRKGAPTSCSVHSIAVEKNWAHLVRDRLLPVRDSCVIM
ncbi:hypothetical protein DCS_07777 [Drechmeria coniospora]|uniref:FAD-binding domain-containing protein n=1 Tax=Drechmeria coniospora TaxID=98403 RepID=A0A151GFD5_DRECN|nr:hypothetical protein DCS_07777 [Drechmeria coniospora]KYK55813.1 hypothetical protein DCS_07777 [Drechmeria coniospora]ODA81598.1 hypothetical protein RJ55_00098 [Drechmeria coniospora]